MPPAADHAAALSGAWRTRGPARVDLRRAQRRHETAETAGFVARSGGTKTARGSLRSPTRSRGRARASGQRARWSASAGGVELAAVTGDGPKLCRRQQRERRCERGAEVLI